MGRFLLAVGKTILTIVVIVGMVIASFYFAYLLIIIVVAGVVGAISWFIFNREETAEWLKYEDSD
ncbi:MAG: hypothetical protein V3S69_03800 [Dehalococcoidales bacterium]